MFLSRSLSRSIIVVIIIGLVAWFVGDKLIRANVSASYAAVGPASLLQSFTTIYGGACDIAVVRLDNYELFSTEGEAAGLSLAAEDIVTQINQARDDARIRGILMLVNSPGGSVPAGEMVANALKRAGKPAAALISDIGDSAAYFAASGAEHIIASPFSDVGDIGVTSSFVNNAASNSKNGDVFEQISSGKYKDTGNPDKQLTEDERALLQRNVNEMYEHLISQIADNRHMPLETVRALADGSSMPGSLALQRGLIDELGDQTTAAAWFASALKRKTVTLCD